MSKQLPLYAYMLKLHRRYSPLNVWLHWGQTLVQEASNKLTWIRIRNWAWKLHSPCPLFPPLIVKFLIIGLIYSICSFCSSCVVCITQYRLKNNITKDFYVNRIHLQMNHSKRNQKLTFSSINKVNCTIKIIQIYMKPCCGLTGCIFSSTFPISVQLG